MSPLFYRAMAIFLISVGAIKIYQAIAGREPKEDSGDMDIPDQNPVNAIVSIGDVVVTSDGVSVVYVARMATDYDGAPTAYGPPGFKTLDVLANAGSDGKWWGVSTDKDGKPLVQDENQPAPGYYISTTSLRKSGPYKGQYKYIDATQVPYVAIPKALFDLGARLGQLVKVSSGAVFKWAVVADVGPAGKIGEGSDALKRSLPVPSDGLYVYKIYTGQKVASPYGLEEIARAARSVESKEFLT